jgi:aspartate/methionine/tyrosine aminotransferase
METINRIEQTYRRLVASGQTITRLFSGNPNDHGFHFPVKILEKAYRESMHRQTYHPHPKGLLSARQAIARYYEEQGMPGPMDPENIIITSGTSESFFNIFSYLAKSGDQILTPNPSYPLFDHIFKLLGVSLRHYSLSEERGWAVDLDDLTQKMNGRVKAIVLISPHNPTGHVLTVSEIGAIIDLANRRQIAIICDEVFSEFYFGKGIYPRPARVEKPWLCFTLNGISKMLALPGYKLAWILVSGKAPAVLEAVDALETTADTFLSCHSAIQEALPTLLAERHPFLNSYVQRVKERRDVAVSLLKQSSVFQLVEPQGGFYAMVEVKKDLGLSEEDLVIALMKKTGIYLHPGYFYDVEKGVHLVISYLPLPELVEQSIKKIVHNIVEYR